MPASTSQVKLALSLWAGNFFSCVFVQVLGAAFMTAVKIHPAYAHAYDSNGAGGVMGVALEPIHGFGKFLLALLALSIIGCNLVNVYSAAFMFQNFHPIMVKVPRFIYTIIATAIIIAVSIAGENSFEEVLQSFLDVIGYYITPFICMVSADYFIIRRRYYPLDEWNDMKRLPLGLAGFLGLGMGFVGGVLSMNQDWYVGVISRAIKPNGCELGWIFSGIFSTVTFIPVRYIEMKLTKR